MERKVLIDEIVNFCIEYEVFNKSFSISEINRRIENGLKDCAFIESLINTIIIKTQNHDNIDVEKIKKLRLELEKIKLDEEYKNQGTDAIDKSM